MAIYKPADFDPPTYLGADEWRKRGDEAIEKAREAGADSDQLNAIRHAVNARFQSEARRLDDWRAAVGDAERANAPGARTMTGEAYPNPDIFGVGALPPGDPGFFEVSIGGDPRTGAGATPVILGGGEPRPPAREIAEALGFLPKRPDGAAFGFGRAAAASKPDSDQLALDAEWLDNRTREIIALTRANDFAGIENLLGELADALSAARTPDEREVARRAISAARTAIGGEITPESGAEGA